jgi:hypothetical protein
MEIVLNWETFSSELMLASRTLVDTIAMMCLGRQTESEKKATASM